MTADNEDGNDINLPSPNEAVDNRPANSFDYEVEEAGDKDTTSNNGYDVESLNEEDNNNNDRINDDAAMAHAVSESLNDTNNITTNNDNNIRINNAAIEHAGLIMPLLSMLYLVQFKFHHHNNHHDAHRFLVHITRRTRGWAIYQ